MNFHTIYYKVKFTIGGIIEYENKKANLNKNIHLSEGNIKSKCTDDILFLTWSLPSRKTCPFATDMCKKKCFAKKNETFQRVRESRQRNLDETFKDSFVDDMIEHLEYQLQRPKAKDKLIIVRIHTSGDFYSVDYFDKWVKIAKYFKENKNILFQAYTKSIRYIWEWVVGDLEEDILGDSDVEEGLREINIHLVYSIWNDTSEEDIEIAKWWLSTNNYEMQTFTALPKEEIENAVKNGAFLCGGDCGTCKECYTGKSKEIVIPYH